MKAFNRFILAAVSVAFFIASAHAQNVGTVTQNAFAIGKGAGTTGYASLLCGSAQLAVGQSAAAPICQTITGDVTINSSGVTALGNIPSGTPMAGSLLATAIAAPATPAAGKDSVWVDSTDKRLHDKNDAGTIGTTVVASTAPANQWANGLSSAGVIQYAQINFSNLAGSLACSQHPALTGDVTSSAGSCATTIAANAVTNAKMATMAAWTFKANMTSGTATPTDATIDGQTLKASPASTDEILIWDVAGSAVKKTTVSALSSAGSVASFNNQTGAIAQGPDCGRFAFSSSTATTFKPYRCELIRIAGTSFAIPSGGITGCGNTSVFVNGTGASNLAASTLYYVYAFSNSGTVTCDFSTTGHATDTTAGNIGTEIKSADNTRTLIGLVFTDASNHFNDSAGLRNVASWFNRPVIRGFNKFTVNRTTTIAFPTEINSEIRIEFVIWSDQTLDYSSSGAAFVSSASAATQLTGVGLDNTTAISGAVSENFATNAVVGNTGVSYNNFGASEGHHFVTVTGGNTNSTTTVQWGDTSTNANALYAQRITIQ